MAAYAPADQRTNTRKVGIYVRISKDREGAGLGVERQEEDCIRLIEYKSRSLGQVWEVHRVYVDNDVSASSKKRRKAYEEMMADLRDGVITCVVAWHVDRLTRKPAEMETIISESEKFGFDLATVQGEIDLGTAAGRLMARNLGAFARYEMEHKSDKQRRANQQAAESGKAYPGGYRAYGYAANGVDIIEDEAEIIREMADRLLNDPDTNVHSLVVELYERGIRTTTGGAFRTTTLRRILRSPRVIGKRTHDGRLYDAEWKGILDVTQQQRIIAFLNDPSRHKGWSDGRTRVYLLSGGLLECGLCSEFLGAKPTNGGIRAYGCRRNSPFGGCSKISIGAVPLEADVAERVLARLASPSVRGRLMSATTSDTHEVVVARIGEAEDKLRELAREWADDQIDKLSYHEARGRLTDRISELRSSIARTTQRLSMPEVFSPKGLAEWWNAETTTVDRRRDLVMTVMDRAVISSATAPGKNGLDPDRITYIWR